MLWTTRVTPSINIRELKSLMAYSGGEMYWVHCIDLIYSALSASVGAKVQ